MAAHITFASVFRISSGIFIAEHIAQYVSTWNSLVVMASLIATVLIIICGLALLFECTYSKNINNLKAVVKMRSFETILAALIVEN